MATPQKTKNTKNTKSKTTQGSSSSSNEEQRRPQELTVTVSRTCQVRQYEPVTITVTERHELHENEDPRRTRLKIYNQVATHVASFMDKELKRYSEGDD